RRRGASVRRRVGAGARGAVAVGSAHGPGVLTRSSGRRAPVCGRHSNGRNGRVRSVVGVRRRRRALLHDPSRSAAGDGPPMNAGAMAAMLVLTGSVVVSTQGAYRSSVDAVAIDVAVLAGARPVSGLTAADFEITDNGVRQTILEVIGETL